MWIYRKPPLCIWRTVGMPTGLRTTTRSCATGAWVATSFWQPARDCWKDTVRANILACHSGQTKRVCRSTLAAEASHLAEAVASGDWIAVLLEEALVGDLDLKNWPEIVERRDRIYVTDARSVYDYLQRDSASTSSDKRMAIEGALLRETVRRPRAFARWVDGLQNIGDVLTKATADKTVLKQFMRDGLLSLVQTEENFQIKEKKRLERKNRKQVVRQESGKEAR